MFICKKKMHVWCIFSGHRVITELHSAHLDTVSIRNILDNYCTDVDRPLPIDKLESNN